MAELGGERVAPIYSTGHLPAGWPWESGSWVGIMGQREGGELGGMGGRDTERERDRETWGRDSETKRLH